MPRGLLIALLGSLLFPAIARGEPPDPPLIDGEVLLTLDSTADSAPTHALLSPNGDFAFIGDRYDAINLWGVIVSTWPVWLAVFLAPLCLWLLWRTWRLFRHRPVIGEPYCVRCGYCLRGVSAASCPECGAELNAKAIAVGRPVRWRVATMLATLVALPTAYGSLYHFDLPRRTAAATWFEWPSRSLASRVDSESPEWLAQNRCSIVRVRQFDLATRRFVGTAYEEVGWTAEMALSPSADRLVVTDFHRFTLYDVNAKRTIRASRAPEWKDRTISWCGTGLFLAATVTPDGRYAFATYRDTVRWDLATGELTFFKGGDAWYEAVRSVPTSKTAALVLETPEPFAARRDGELSTLRVRDRRGADIATFTLSRYTWMWPKCFSTDGSRLYVYNIPMLEEWDLNTGRRTRAFRWDTRGRDRGDLIGPVANRLLLVSEERIETLDLTTGRQTETRLLGASSGREYDLVAGEFRRPPLAAVTPDGSGIVVGLQSGSAIDSRLRIRLYRVSDLLNEPLASR